MPWWDAFRHVALNVTSVVTTTGFALGDYSLWGNFSLMLFFYLGFIGGCSGSTAGGIKDFSAFRSPISCSRPTLIS